VRKELVEALPQLQAVAIRDRMADLADLSAAVRPVVAGDFALVGVRVVDGTGAAPLEDATVVVRGDRIAAVGPRDQVTVPEGVEPLDAAGLTVVAGLWDMHGHVSQIEWGQAYLAAGVTTVRDMGGERRFLTAFRDAVDEDRALGPRMVLAGIVDGNDSLSFGMVTASTPAEGRAVVDGYHDEGFRQMKLYSRLRPEVVAAITARAHELGMTVTGHVPSALTLQEAVAAGMDEVAHMPLRGQDREVMADLAVLAEAGTVVDPTQVWGELLGRSRATPIADFEPGIRAVAGPMAANYQGATSDASPGEVRERLRANLARVKAMWDAGVPIVAGTDGAVPGVSLLRELELYVAAGLTPTQALQAATVVPARALGMADEVGTVEVGKRADLLVLEGDPLTDISNLRLGRWVVVRGRVFDMDEFRP
jgi:imidazolonepropionase-like amidohydrolase